MKIDKIEIKKHTDLNVVLYQCFRKNCDDDCGKGHWTAELNDLGNEKVFTKKYKLTNNNSLYIGCGKTPEAAVKDLFKYIKIIKNTDKMPR